MASSIAWLDTSPDEQRRVNELLALFTQKETRDELGVAQIRDVFSNALFPGTSVLQTRARYYLFVPWAYKKAFADGHSGARAAQVAHATEREMIQPLKAAAGSESGVIGARAGLNVRTLPSSMFWNGMLTYGILRRDVDPAHLRGIVRSTEADEPTSRLQGDWHPTLPPVPPGFPHTVDGFAMTQEEATWLREAIVTSTRGSLLANLLEQGELPNKGVSFPWLDPVVLSAARDQQGALDDARRFASVIAGASRLYAVVIAEAYQAAGLGGDGFNVSPYRDVFTAWVDRELTTIDWGEWDLDGFWSFVQHNNARISPATQVFVRAWMGLCRDGSLSAALESDSGARRLVARREAELKRSQSRLTNRKLLSQWGGAGLGRRDSDASPDGPGVDMHYRWPNVRQIVTDILEGTNA